MISSKDFYQQLLKNERGFHLLFCDLDKQESFSFYHNESFSEDPIFNHFVIEERILTETPSDISRERTIIKEIKGTSSAFKLSASIFIENFWPNVSRLESTSIEMGYRLTDRMEILCKSVRDSTPIKFNFQISKTEKVEEWNRVFMQSYGIPRSWEQELISREKDIVGDPKVVFLIAKDPQTNEAIGCLLTFADPDDFLGIYCVGTIPSQRGKGVAFEMLSFAESIALTHHFKFLTLQTLTSDHVSPLYKKIGYKTNFERDILWSP